jgi:His/Glu/Gln/Arg/opine family amino acid ABC transporter permease subunit
MRLDVSIILNNLPMFVQGFFMTLWICVVALILALVFGSLIAIARTSRFRLLSLASVAYVEVFRNVPFMIQVFLFYYVLPLYGLRFPPYVVGVIALGMFSAAYFAEIIRSAIASIPRGQMESARAAGMSYLQAMRYIIFPQIWGFLIPPATNQTTSLVKESSILSTITVAELTMAAQRIQLETYSFLEPLILISALYWAFNATLMYGAKKLEIVLQPFRYAPLRVAAT